MGLSAAYLGTRYRPTKLIATEPLAENLAVPRRNAHPAPAPGPSSRTRWRPRRAR
ncbi:hypothetical protein AB0D04_13575 [Streptomyces sp. NPDC048483]|uniref:hypothetical protein n=1 Tax=Streptomyces sp. NPDC048483 TaxID=3154927 RepID=UPI003445AD84